MGRGAQSAASAQRGCRTPRPLSVPRHYASLPPLEEPCSGQPPYETPDGDEGLARPLQCSSHLLSLAGPLQIAYEQLVEFLTALASRWCVCDRAIRQRKALVKVSTSTELNSYTPRGRDFQYQTPEADSHVRHVRMKRSSISYWYDFMSGTYFPLTQIETQL